MDHVEFFPSAPTNYFRDYPDRRWPAWKFDMDLDDLFNTLPQQFNCMMMPVLDSDAFSRDVLEISCKVQDRPELFRLLRERMDLRRKELLDMWLNALREISGSPSLLVKHDAQWSDAMHIYHFKSFDTYVRYFAGFLGSNLSSETARASHTQIACDQERHSSPTSRSSTLSSRGDRGSYSSIPTSAPSLNQPATETQVARAPSHRRKKTTMRSSNRIRKEGAGERKALRRSSRIQQKHVKLLAESGIHTRSKTTCPRRT